MKGFSLFVILLCIACLTVCANSNSDDKFINSLRSCSSYNESGTTNIGGTFVKSQKQIFGWENEKCKYSEDLDYGGMKIKLVCNFSKSQIDEIVSVADAYYLTLKYSNKQPDFSSIDDAQNNPVVRVLSKYLHDASICNFDGLQ